MIIHSKDKTMASLFWIPMNYNFQIRLQHNNPRMTSWLFINFFTTIYYALICTSVTHWTEIVALCIFSCSIFYLYEWGYIYNDIKAVQHETAPTLRLNKAEMEYGNNHFRQITIARFAIFTVGLLITYLLLPTTNALIAIGLATTCPLLFFGYNQWRSKYNAFLYFWLVASRFVPFVWIIESDQQVLKTLLILLVYPLEIGIERFSIPNYRYPIIKKIIPNEKAKPTFRVLYYSIALIILGYLLGTSSITLNLALPFFVFWIYRCVVYFKQRKGADSLS